MARDHPHRRRNVALLVAGAAVVALGAALAIDVLLIEAPGPASVDEALDRFQDDGRNGGTDDGTRPAEGVYVYTGEGREHLSFPPLTQRDGARMPATVTYEPEGCWVFRLDYNAEHWQDWRYCPTRDGGLAETGGRTHQTWDLGVTTATNVSNFTCDPPAVVLPPADGLEPGHVEHHRCTGVNSAIEGSTVSEGVTTFEGPGTLDIGGTAVDALHFTRLRTISGSQDGSERVELWFRADGLLLRMERDIRADSPSPVGDITYTEEGTLQLARIDPRV